MFPGGGLSVGLESSSLFGEEIAPFHLSSDMPHCLPTNRELELVLDSRKTG